MDFIDETMEVLTKDDVCGGTRDTTYMYANHKTNTYINASNNQNSYCSIVNEALEDRHFNTIICESRDVDGNKWVYYKATKHRSQTRIRNAIRSYCNASKKYTDEFLRK